MVVHVVVNFVDGAAHQVIGPQNAELVLDFVVVVAEPAVAATGAEHGVDAGALFLVDEHLRSRLVHIHHLVGHQPPSSVAHNGHPHEQPPVLAHQLDVRPQIFETDEGSLRILCHLAQKYFEMRSTNIILGFMVLFAVGITAANGQYNAADGICCDPTSADFAGSGTCGPLGQLFESPVDDLVCDPNCFDYTDGSGCTSIPIDGGLSLLALAGGGLATAAMRRRREEEEAAAQCAA